ncbi:GNAT family N-acetyltransferase [Streptomyces sp. NPDC051940]|uniref:GNAT family N-acetyltransferase n=1 Tax=Streptomyces sp. NPDC051940 TaxID=3155675 RepID=UPI00342B5903
MEIRPVRYDHPDAARLDARVQAEYVERYGDGDSAPMDPEEFEPPHGRYFLVYDDAGTPVATGGWRARSGGSEEGYADGDAEIKRMYVVPEARGLGLARRVLAALEADARAAGRVRMVLETGIKQPEAMSLYVSEGYESAAQKFGTYRDYDDSRCYTKVLPVLVAHPAAPVREWERSSPLEP